MITQVLKLTPKGRAFKKRKSRPIHLNSNQNSTRDHDPQQAKEDEISQREKAWLEWRLRKIFGHFMNCSVRPLNWDDSTTTCEQPESDLVQEGQVHLSFVDSQLNTLGEVPQGKTLRCMAYDRTIPEDTYYVLKVTKHRPVMNRVQRFFVSLFLGGDADWCTSSVRLLTLGQEKKINQKIIAMHQPHSQ